MTVADRKMSLRLRPVTFREANAVVTRLHRHHGPVPPGFHNFCVGVEKDGDLVGVAIVGRPANRNSHDGETLEVLRVATDGTRNACSMLLGACARAAKAMGAARIITYTLESEGGASLKAAGWVQTKNGIKSWWLTPSAGRTVAVERDHFQQEKARWEAVFG